MAIGGVEAGGTGAHVIGEDALGLFVVWVEFFGNAIRVLRFREDGAMDGDDGDAEFLFCAILGEEFAGAHFWRWEEDAGRGIGRIFEAFVGAEDSGEHFGFIVPGGEVVVGDGPIEADALAGLGFKIVGAVAKGDAAPVIGAAAHHALAPPGELAEIFFTCVGVGFAGDGPTGLDGGVVEAVLFIGSGGGAEGRHIRGMEHGGFADGIDHAAGFEDEDLDAFHGEGVCDLTAGGARSDDNGVVCGLGLFRGDDGHGKGVECLERVRVRESFRDWHGATTMGRSRILFHPLSIE